MRVLSWNVRGLGKPRTRLAIKKVLHLHQPHLFFCCETKMTAQQVATICKKFDFENCFVVDRNRMGGGLTLFWNSGVDVTIKSYSSHHIDAIVQNQSDKIWRCTGVYGHAETSQKHHTWTLLKRLVGLYSYS